MGILRQTGPHTYEFDRMDGSAPETILVAPEADANPEGINQYTGGGGSGGPQPAKQYASTASEAHAATAHAREVTGKVDPDKTGSYTAAASAHKMAAMHHTEAARLAHDPASKTAHEVKAASHMQAHHALNREAAGG